MTAATIDIVIPVWNKPNETRNCLVNLINYTPDVRLVMLDNGSERETEKLLQEIADGLDERALLMRDDSNIGFVRAANRGLARSEAPYIGIMRSTTDVSSGWIEPLVEFFSAHADAGILVPRLAGVEPPCGVPIEVATCSFSAMVMTRAVYDAVGGFDEGMDGGTWCLKDFTRRACSKGFLTYLVPASSVTHQEEVVLGSQKRREETLRHSKALFAERWGEERAYCVHIPKGLELPLLKQKFECFVRGARHGDTFFVLLPSSVCKDAQHEGVACLHENVRVVSLPRFATAGSKGRVYQRLIAERPDLQPVAGVDGIAFPWSEKYINFTQLAEMIRSC